MGKPEDDELTTRTSRLDDFSGRGTGTAAGKPSNGWRQAFRNAFATLVVAGAVIVGYLYHLSRELPSIAQLQNFSPAVATKIISRDGKVISLTPSEYKLLHCLMSSPGRVYSRSELLERLYDNGGVVIDRVVDVHIGKLRQKIDGTATKPPLLRTVHGVGYALNEDAVTGQG